MTQGNITSSSPAILLSIKDLLHKTCVYFNFSDVIVKYNIENEVLTFLFLKESEYFFEITEEIDSLTEEDLQDFVKESSEVIQVDFVSSCLEDISLDSFLTIVSIELENTQLGARTIIH